LFDESVSDNQSIEEPPEINQELLSYIHWIPEEEIKKQHKIGEGG